MKICIAQTKSDKGNIVSNIEHHKKWIDLAISEKADLIVFPELSLTGYEPFLAEELATNQNDSRLEEFQQISNQHKIAIGVGLPTRSESKIFISMIIFEPNQVKKTYSKQQLHSGELAYFSEGNEQVLLTIKNEKIAPAICYESLQPEHSENAVKLGAKIYLASVAKPQDGIEKAFEHFSEIARKYSMSILMVNCIGYCDTFESVGQSSIWNENGVLIGQLSNQSEGMLVYDTETKKIVKKEKTFNTSNGYNN